MIYTVTLNPAVDRELTIKDFAYDTVLRASDSRVDLGGKGFNVSRMLRNLETESVAMGFVGGKSGEMLEEGLNALGIRTDFVWVDGETRTNTVVIDENHDKYLKVNESGKPVSEEKVTELIAKIMEVAQEGDWWVFAGSLPPNVPTNIYATLIEIVQSVGGFAILDASKGALGLGCEANPFLVKPNDVEIEALTEEPDLEIGANILLGRGVKNVVVSRGAEGALLMNKNGTEHVPSHKIVQKNPIGAGDSMVGGLVYGLSNGLPVVEALSWGIACGAATASKEGTTLGTKAEVEALMAGERS